MSTYTCRGIILRQQPIHEADQMFTIYTDTVGKISALGRGTKKAKSKLNYQLQPFAVAMLMIASGSKSHDHIAGVEILHNYYDIKKNFRKIILASYGVEVVDKLTHWLSPDSRIFELLVWYLDHIEQAALTDEEWKELKHEYIGLLLTHLGYQPEPEISENQGKLDYFLKTQLSGELNTEKFLSKMIA